MANPIDLTLRAQTELLAEGTISPSDVMVATDQRIAKRDLALRSVVHLGSLQGEGIPYGVKDIIDVAGMPTRCGSHAHHAGEVTDAAAVARLRESGLIPVAKLATYEYALTGPAWDQPNLPACNPWNTDHITGGSSSGSAAAVAGGLFRFALGTDTGGSIRAPAAYCGIVGLKPTHGTVHDTGCFPLSQSLDVIGPLAACVEDAAFVMEKLAPETAATQDIAQGIAGLRIAYARDWFANDPKADPALVAALDDAAATMSRLGAKIELISLPDYQPLEDAGTVIMQAEAWMNHQAGLAERLDAYGIDARRNLLTGAVLSDEDVEVARLVGAKFHETVNGLLVQFDAILTPTTLAPAPTFADFKDGPVWTAMRTLPFNLSGHPAISVPCGFAANGLPLGLQLVGGMGQERMICRIAYAFEQATDFSARPAIGAEPVSLEDQA